MRPTSRFDSGARDSRVGRCSAESHKLGWMWFDSHTRNCRCSWHGTPTGIAARSRAWCLWVRIPPVLLPKFITSSSGEDACLTHRIAQVRVLPGRLSAGRSAGVPAAHLLGREGDRVRFSGGPSWERAGGSSREKGSGAAGFGSPAGSFPQSGCWSNGTTPASHAGDRGSTPRRSTVRRQRP